MRLDCYGHTAQSWDDNAEPYTLREVTLRARPDVLWKIGVFLQQVARQIDAGGRFDHQHIRELYADRWPPDAPDIIVAHPGTRPKAS